MRGQLPREERRRGGVPAVQLVAHPQRPADQRLQRDAAGSTDDVPQYRGEPVPQEIKARAHVRVERPVVQPVPRLALIEVAVRAVAAVGILHHEHRHRGRVDPRDRANAAMIVSSRQDDPAIAELGIRVVRVAGQSFVERAVHNRIALPAVVLAPGHRRARGQDRAVRHAGDNLAGRLDVDQDRLGTRHPRDRFRVRAGPVRHTGLVHWHPTHHSFRYFVCSHSVTTVLYSCHSARLYSA